MQESLEILGLTPDATAVVGSLKGENSDQDRPVLIVLNQQRKPNKQKAYVQSARKEALAGIIPIAGVEHNIKFMGVSPLSLVIGQSLSTLARMNEPHFVERRVKPSRGAKSSRSGHFAYFEAINIGDFGPAPGYRTMNEDGTSESVSLHRVKKHRRRIYDKETGRLKRYTNVKTHLRASARVGVKSASVDLSRD